MSTIQRQTLISSVESDINAMGWDRPARVFLLQGEPGDEFLRMMSEVEGHVGDFLEMATTSLGPIPENGSLGLAVATEGWTYPRHIGEQLAKMTAEEQAEYGKLVRPSEHPERREVRSVILVTRDGEVAAITRIRGGNDGEDEVLAETDMTGRLVEQMKVALGLNEEFNKAFAEQQAKMKDAIEKCLAFMVGALDLGKNPSREGQVDYLRRFCKENNLPDDLAEGMIAFVDNPGEFPL